MVACRQAIGLRLRAERPWQEHERLYVDLFADPAVAARLWPGPLGGARTPEQAAGILRADLAHWREYGYGPWVFFEVATGMFVGRGGLRRATFADGDSVEVLYALRADAWGRGYGTEIARVAVAHARRLRLREVIGITMTANTASRRVLEKSGMRIEPRPVEHAGLPHWIGRLLPNI